MLTKERPDDQSPEAKRAKFIVRLTAAIPFAKPGDPVTPEHFFSITNLTPRDVPALLDALGELDPETVAPFVDQLEERYRAVQQQQHPGAQWFELFRDAVDVVATVVHQHRAARGVTVRELPYVPQGFSAMLSPAQQNQSLEARLRPNANIEAALDTMRQLVALNPTTATREERALADQFGQQLDELASKREAWQADQNNLELEIAYLTQKRQLDQAFLRYTLGLLPLPLPAVPSA